MLSRTRVVPVKKIPECYPGAFTESSIRYLIFNEKSNGFSRCLIRIGKKVLIDLEQMDIWLDQQRGGAQ